MPTQQELDAASKKMQEAIAGKNPTAVSGVTTTGAPMLTGLAKTGATGPEGAYNPYTKGYETTNGGVWVNQGQYSAQAKADLAKSYGYAPNEVQLSDFYRNEDGSLGIKKEKKAAPAVPEVPAATAAPVTPAPVTPAAPEAPASTGTPESVLADAKSGVAQATEADKLYHYSEQMQAAREKLDAESKIQLDEATRKYDTAIKTQEANMAKDSANAGVILGTQGASRSLVAQRAVSAMNQKNKDLYSQLTISKDRTLTQLADSLYRAQTSLDDEYKKNVSANQQEMLQKIYAMQATGELNSKQGFQVAYSYLESVLDNNITLQEGYAAGAQAMFDQYKIEAEKAKGQTEVDTNLTKQMNDGYVYNKFGAKIQQEDDLGNPSYLTYDVSKDEKFLSNVTLPDGTNGAIMQKSDGSTYLKEFRSSNVSAIQPDQITAYAQAYAQGKLPDATLKSLPQSVQAQIIQQAVATGFSGNLESVTVKVNGKDKTMLFDKSTGTYTDPFATSQEGSIASGVTVSEDGTVAFDDKAEAAARKAGINVDLLEVPDGTVRKRAECGQYVNDVLGTPSKFKDSIEDKVKACNASKPSVGSAVVLDVGTSTGHVGIVVGVDEEAGEIIVKSSNAHGYDENGNPTGISTDRISYMDDQGNMNPAVKGFYAPKFEATEEPAKAQDGNYTAMQQVTMDKILAGKGTQYDDEKLTELGLTDADLDKYKASKPKTTELSDDQRVIYNSEKARFLWNQVIKDYETQIGQTLNGLSSLGADSGPGDIAAIYQFMKVLDPSSVVREAEFETAAKSAGVFEYLGNTWERIEASKKLTDTQREAFGKLMKVYVQNKSSQYDRLYDDMARVLDLSWVPKEYMPTRASEQAAEKLWFGEPKPQQYVPGQEIDLDNLWY